MTRALLLVLLAGCPAGGDDYPIIPGGGDDHTQTPMVDAPVSDGIPPGGMLTGRVCVVTDIRTVTASACATTGAANITVTLGTETTLTADDGAFMLLTPSGTNLVWHTSGTNLVSSVIPLTTSNILPMVSDQTYLDLKNGNSVIVNSGEGTVMLYLRKAGLPLANVTTTVNPVASYPSLGDRTNATNWVQGATGALGVSWTPGIIAGSATLTVTPPDAAPQATITVPVEDGAITYATLVIP